MNRKPYISLSDRQKIWRRETFFVSSVKLRKVDSSETEPTSIAAAAEFSDSIIVPAASSVSELNTSVYFDGSSAASEDAYEHNMDLAINSDSKCESNVSACSTSDCPNQEFYSPIATEDTIKTVIINWFIDCPNVPSLSITNLLHHLHYFYSGLPLTAKTIIKPLNFDVSITRMHHGRYVHFNNWKKCVKNYLESLNYNHSYFDITINIDGIPLFKDSRKFHAYPILVKVCTDLPKIFCAGLYLSEDEISNKMPNVDELLARFVEDVQSLQTDGIQVERTLIRVNIKAFVCDAPARSNLKK